METQLLTILENLIIMIDTNLGLNGQDPETVEDCNNAILGSCPGEKLIL